MLPYQNLNPNYFAQYPQYQQPIQPNPYMRQIENLQQFQQNLQPQPQMQVQQPFLPIGKMVESVDMVKVADIPMDGNMYYFPKADGSEIYSKQFMPNGQTRILTFKPILEDEPNTLSNDEEKLKFDAFACVLEGIQNDIKTLNDKIDKIAKPTRAKKEAAEDE